jgi:hypothetical protein
VGLDLADWVLDDVPLRDEVLTALMMTLWALADLRSLVV